jgi:single-stranded DNA-binding protein
MSVSYHEAELRLRGNIANIETKTVGDGLKIAEVRLAADVGEWNSDEEEEDIRTEWFDVTFFGGAAKYIEQGAEKGDKLSVTAKPKTSTWEDDDGNTRYNREWVYNNGDMYIISDGDGGATSPEEQLENESSGPPSGGSSSSSNDEPDDDLPF